MFEPDVKKVENTRKKIVTKVDAIFTSCRERMREIKEMS